MPKSDRAQIPPAGEHAVIYRVDPDDYTYGNLRYFGSVHSAIGFLLFALGCAALLLFGVLALQASVASQKSDVDNVKWLIPLWGVFAVPLGLSMRRKRPAILSLLLGCMLLAIPLILNTISV
jgi:hypothetical protein